MSVEGKENYFFIGYKRVGTCTHTNTSKFDFVTVSKCVFMRVHKMVKRI